MGAAAASNAEIIMCWPAHGYGPGEVSCVGRRAACRLTGGIAAAFCRLGRPHGVRCHRILSIMSNQFLTSIVRVSDLDQVPFDVRPLPREEWATGDYVACEVIGSPGPLYRIELLSGRRTPVLPGDLLIGAFGARAATHECVGDWRQISEDLKLHQLTAAGLFGKVTSNSSWEGRPMELVYRGHAMRDGKLNAADYIEPVAKSSFDMPVVLIAGTSMSSGKTLTGRRIINQLSNAGYSVAAAKLTGAAGYKDALSFADAGAGHVFDYVDAGLVSTVCPPEAYAPALEILLERLAGTGADVAVCEIGASPLEPYNGATALDRIRPFVRAFALCSSDAYAAKGLCDACGCTPDFVTGPAANNVASRSLVEKLTGLMALDLSGAEGAGTLRALLQEKLRKKAA